MYIERNTTCYLAHYRGLYVHMQPSGPIKLFTGAHDKLFPTRKICKHSLAQESCLMSQDASKLPASSTPGV